ncbi:MAG: cytochrome c biogenesis protein DipZ [Candidatus Altimarinota bacterium]
MNLALLLTSFLAGLLTVLAPCVLPLLPVIVGGSLTGKNKWKPVIIAFSLAASVVIFTLLLKVSTLLIDIPQEFWTIFSGGIILIFGLFLLFPGVWDWISVKLKFSQNSEEAMQKVQTGGDSWWSSVLLGAALGPVFSSCSPTYFLILATVLPVNFGEGLIYLLVYALGVALILLAISYLGRALTSKLKFAANPRGWFKRGLGILLIVVGLLILTGVEKWVEEKILEAGFGVTQLEEDLLKTVNMPDQAVNEAIDQSENVAFEPGKKKLNRNDIYARILADFGPAPELVGLENWLNSEPLSLESLKGKVVLIDFWTYSCINCIRTLPYLQSWEEKYADQGLVIIGVHAPEFQFEKKIENVRKAVLEEGLTYPIVQDNNFETWRAYKNHYWPAKYIIDQNGTLRYFHFGEGEYEETEEIIQELLGEKSELVASEVVAEKGKFGGEVTYETYLGTDRRDNLVEGDELAKDQWTLRGKFINEEERIVSGSGQDVLKMKFYGNTANLVMGGQGTVEVLIDGKPLLEGAGSDVGEGLLEVDGERMYRLTDFGGEYKERTIELRFLGAGIEAYAWTFG